MQISVQIGLNWNWPTGTELGNIRGIAHVRANRKDDIWHFHAKTTSERLYTFIGVGSRDSSFMTWYWGLEIWSEILYVVVNEFILNEASCNLLSNPLPSIYSSYKKNWQYVIFIETQSNMIGATGSYHIIGEK